MRHSKVANRAANSNRCNCRIIFLPENQCAGATYQARSGCKGLPKALNTRPSFRACTGRASCRREPFRTRSDGSSQGQRFPFVLPTPGDPKNKTLDYSVFLPIQGSPGYDIHNRVPYAEHYNLSIQRELSPSMAVTLAYVGTQGHRLIAQTESNPGNPALCLSLRGSG